MKEMTITANIKSGEVAYFKVLPLGSFEKFIDDVEKVTTPESVIELEKKGCWIIK